MNEIPRELYWGDTLGDTVLKLVEAGKKDSDEFKILSQVFGVEKLRKLYKEALERRKEKNGLLQPTEK